VRQEVVAHEEAHEDEVVDQALQVEPVRDVHAFEVQVQLVADQLKPD
jgi:hypothetical protein